MITFKIYFLFITCSESKFLHNVVSDFKNIKIEVKKSVYIANHTYRFR